VGWLGWGRWGFWCGVDGVGVILWAVAGERCCVR